MSNKFLGLVPVHNKDQYVTLNLTAAAVGLTAATIAAPAAVLGAVIVGGVAEAIHDACHENGDGDHEHRHHHHRKHGKRSEKK